MAYAKKTLRRMPEKTRKVARLINDLESVTRRLKNQVPTIQAMELWDRAEIKRQQAIERGEL